MPGRNGTGPSGQGPMSGRGMGPCNTQSTGLNTNQGIGFGMGRGLGSGRGLGAGRKMGAGRGMGRGINCRYSYSQYGQFSGELDAETSKNILEQRKGFLETQLENIKQSLNSFTNEPKE